MCVREWVSVCVFIDIVASQKLMNARTNSCVSCMFICAHENPCGWQFSLVIFWDCSRLNEGTGVFFVQLLMRRWTLTRWMSHESSASLRCLAAFLSLSLHLDILLVILQTHSTFCLPLTLSVHLSHISFTLSGLSNTVFFLFLSLPHALCSLPHMISCH